MPNLQSHESQNDNENEAIPSKHRFMQTFDNPIKPTALPQTTHAAQGDGVSPRTFATMKQEDRRQSVQDLGITSQELAMRLQETMAKNAKKDSQNAAQSQNTEAMALNIDLPKTDSLNKDLYMQDSQKNALQKNTPQQNTPQQNISQHANKPTQNAPKNIDDIPTKNSSIDSNETTKRGARTHSSTDLHINTNTDLDSSTNLQKDSQKPHTKALKPHEPLFQKTQALLQRLADCSIFDDETLQKGMKIDLSSGDSDFFELYIGAQLHYACAYISVLDERSFAKKDSPDLHFMRCDSIKKVPQDLIKVCVPTKNAFDYRVRSSGIDTRLFYEHPLRVCPSCIALLCQLLSTKHKRAIMPNQIKEDEILGLLFKNKLKNLIL